MERFSDTCALFAVSGHRSAAAVTALGLQVLGYRGNEHLAVAVSDGALIRTRRGPDALPARPETLPGVLAIGKIWGPPEQLRRARSHDPLLAAGDDGDSDTLVSVRYRGGQIAAAIAGRITNAGRLRRELKELGAVFHTLSDAEVLVNLVAHSAQRTLINRLVDALWKVEGAYTLLVQSEDRLVAVRGPGGFRPLVLGRLEDAWMVATDDSAFQAVGGEAKREVAPGEMLILDGRGMLSVSPFGQQPLTACLQEHISLASSASRTFGRSTREVRARVGEALASEAPCPGADVVTAWPGPALPMAQGFARAADLPFEVLVVREPPVVAPPPDTLGPPDLADRLLWRVDPSVGGRSVVLVLPALVTGHGLRRAVASLLEAGAREVHVRIGSPPVHTSCAYGVWSPTPDELADAETVTHPDWSGAASIRHLDLARLREVADDERGWCDACWSGKHPLRPPDLTDDQLELF
ncbi:MAG: hypothetical protein H6738_16330 [Alphaproteobacteria bacterium]|nr:hypothetical protein [Alphaproteobacteria bacterium]MCB9698348.1 hypothetical protein [Alphaproteobacteria bacterium]